MPFRSARPAQHVDDTHARADAPVAEVWKVIEDPYQMPRWWPGVERMEGVEDDRFTQVFKTKRGRTVRADFRVLASEPPGGEYTAATAPGPRRSRGRRSSACCSESITEIVVEPADGGTRVTIGQRQQLRGYRGPAALAMRRATEQAARRGAGRAGADPRLSGSGALGGRLSRVAGRR